MKKTILMTGINGFIAKNLAPRLKKEYILIGTTSSIDKADKRIYDKIYEFNFKNEKLPDIKENIDIILHTATLTDFNIINNNPIKAFDINVIGTIKVLELGRKKKIKKFVHLSTGSVYVPGEGAVTENSKLGATDFYSISKLLSDEVVGFYNKFLNTAIIRYFHPYGPGQENTRLIPRLINNIIKRKEITIFNEGKNPRLSPTFIDDIVNLTIEVIKCNENGIFNIGGNEIASVKDICHIISEILKIEPKYNFISDTNSKDLYADNSKVKKLFKYNNFVDLKKGIRRTIDYYEN